jgi:hypothetical protein
VGGFDACTPSPTLHAARIHYPLCCTPSLWMVGWWCNRHSAVRFMAVKVKRLGIPFLAWFFGLNPLMCVPPQPDWYLLLPLFPSKPRLPLGVCVCVGEWSAIHPKPPTHVDCQHICIFCCQLHAVHACVVRCQCELRLAWSPLRRWPAHAREGVPSPVRSSLWHGHPLVRAQSPGSQAGIATQMKRVTNLIG